MSASPAPDQPGGVVPEIDTADGQPDVARNGVRLDCWEVTGVWIFRRESTSRGGPSMRRTGLGTQMEMN